MTIWNLTFDMLDHLVSWREKNIFLKFYKLFHFYHLFFFLAWFSKNCQSALKVKVPALAIIPIVKGELGKKGLK